MIATGHRVKSTIVLLLLALHVVYALFATQPGHFTVDEGAYHMMVKAMAEDGSLAVWNGYGETPSEELVYSMLRKDLRDPASPRMVPQYPATYAFIAAPFYMAGGFAGLFWLNLLAFFGAVWATTAIARRLYGDPGLALNAALILILGTYTWEYAQGAWPHALSMFLVTAAVLAGIAALQEKSSGRATAWMGVAGLIVGIGAGVRYDAILAAPALALPFLFAAPPRIKPLAGLAAGLVPGLLLLAYTNHAKFGIFSPFTYGADSQGGIDSIRGYIFLMLAGSAAVGLAWVATRQRVRNLYRGRPLWIAAAIAIAVGGVIAIPQARGLIVRLIDGFLQLVVDLRFRPDIEEWGVSRTATGGLAYGQWLKHALLQSCPWLVVLAIPAADWLRRRDPGRAMLFLVIGAFIVMYGRHLWHGGLSLNMRYFLPFLPLAAILGAEGWRALSADLPERWRRTATVAGLASAVIWIPAIMIDGTLAVEPVLLTTPLIIAAMLSVMLVLRTIPATRFRQAIGVGGLALSATALAWAFSISFSYDLPRSTVARAVNYQLGADIRQLVEPDAILFTRYANRVSVLIDDDIRLAFPRNDDFTDFRRLLELHLAQGRPVYLAFNDEYWARAKADDLLEGLEMEDLYENGDVRLVRVRGP